MLKKGHVFYRSQNKDYPVAVRGEGVYLYDGEGKRYLDGSSGCLVTNIGYGVSSVAEALKNEALKTGYAHGSTFTTEAQEELAALVTEKAPEGLDYAYFLSGGTEANETAISMALQYHMQRGKSSKYKVIGRRLSYHGSSFATLSAAGNVERRKMYSPLLMNFPLIPAPHCYRCYYGLSYPQCGIICAEELEKTILAEGADNVAAFIAEPIIGTSAAASVPPKEYFPRIREICSKHDVLLICDEVLCGYGRPGSYTAQELWGVTSDLTTLGKGLGGGYIPMGAVIAHKDIHDVFSANWGKFYHGYTYQGNPVSCAGAVAVHRYLREQKLFEQVGPKGELLKKNLHAAFSDHPHVGDIRGIGLLMGLELVLDRSSKESFDPALSVAEKVRETALEEGLITYTGVGPTADIIPRDYLVIGPPFTISEAEIEMMIQKLAVSLEKTLMKLGYAK